MNPLDNVGTASGGNFQLGGGMDSLYGGIKPSGGPGIQNWGDSGFVNGRIGKVGATDNGGRPQPFSNIQDNPGAQNFLKYAQGSSLNPNPQASPYGVKSTAPPNQQNDNMVNPYWKNWTTGFNPSVEKNNIIQQMTHEGYGADQIAELVKGMGF